MIGPQPGQQTQFLSCPADIAIYGGAAGAGKTYGELLEPLRHINNPAFGAVVFRRTYPEIMNTGGLWDTSHEIYPLFGGKPNRNDKTWTFPSGMTVAMRHLQRVQSVYAWQGAQVPLFLFDELTHFAQAQFFYMLTRNRSLCGVIPYVRGSCNPDPDSWVAKLIGWWIDEDTGFPIVERSGVIRWFVRVGGELKWADSRAEAVAIDIVGPKQSRPKSLTFIPGTIYDNPALMKGDPNYLSNLLAQDVVTQGRLLAGNWKIRATAGVLFQRGWYRVEDEVPAGGFLVRFWDFAATAAKINKTHADEEIEARGPDFTSSCLGKMVNGVFYIIDVTEDRLGPAEADSLMLNLASQDYNYAIATGCSGYAVKWEEEGAASGKRDSAKLMQLLHGFDAEAVRPQGDKITRAKPLARQSKAGNVKLRAGKWNESWLTHMHNQPQWAHDDQMDATSGCYNALNDVSAFEPASAGSIHVVDAYAVMRAMQQQERSVNLQRMRNGY